MHTRRTLVMSVLTLGFLGSLAVSAVRGRPKTWIVDDGGGAGVHFTDIPPAIAAAQDGDLILVRSGSYSGFDLSKALTLVGEPGAVIAGDVVIAAAPGAVLVASLEVNALQVIDCASAVILDGVRARAGPGSPIWIQLVGTFAVEARNSADVRLVDCALQGWGGDSNHALLVWDSRVELVGSTLAGTQGADDDCSFGIGYAGHGGDGLRAEGASRVHASRSSFTGGAGGDSSGSLCQMAYAGDGGDGAVALQPTELVVTGGDFTGGDAGVAAGAPLSYTYCGSGGSGLAGTAQLRHSGAQFTRGAGSGSCPDGDGNGLGGAIATPPDPTLERLGTPVASTTGSKSSSVLLRVRGAPGSSARLFLGTRPVVQPTQNVAVERLVERAVALHLGTFPSSGRLDYVLPLGPDWPVGLYAGGRLIVAQAECLYPGGVLRRTNSVPLVLR